jgi:[acyl-carrier-protein] S-malonyltransferase
MTGSGSTVVVAPGQGSQAPRMLTPWLRDPELRAVVDSWSCESGLDLIELGTKAPAATIVDTEIAQPLLVAAGLLALQTQSAVDLAGDASALVTAGHSIGELVAAVAAGVLRPEQAVRLAVVRGRAMAASCGTAETGMTALLGGDPDELVCVIEGLGLQVANRNAPGQLVVAGPLAALTRVEQAVPEQVKVRPLQVAGAFHTAAMAAAQDEFAAAVAGEDFADPICPWLSNADGEALETGSDAADSLVRQIVSPVRWDLVTRGIAARDPRVLIELPPAGTLTGIAKRELPSVRAIPIASPATLRRAAATAA